MVKHTKSACLIQTSNVDSPLKHKEECLQTDTNFLVVESAHLSQVLTLTSNDGFGQMEKWIPRLPSRYG